MQSNVAFYAPTIGVLQNNLKRKRVLQSKVVSLNESLSESQTLYVRMLNAQKLLATVSDNNTAKTLDFITGMVNKVLSEIFPEDVYQIKLKKKLFAGNKPHIILELQDGSENTLDLKIQSGAGLRQIVSFMYVICLIEIRKGRKLLILDERLNGLHKSAKTAISQIIKIFVKGGYQFIFVEYSLNDIGKIYNVEKRGKESTLISMEGVDYTDDLVHVSDVDLSVLDKNFVEEENLEEPEENKF